MALVEDLEMLDRMLADLVTRYDQYFIGLEKREPLKLRSDVENLVRRYAGTAINNTMYKHKYVMLVARLNTYREHWNRILRLMDEGKYFRDRFIGNLHLQQKDKKGNGNGAVAPPQPSPESELERIYEEFREARKACNLSVAKLTREMVAETIEKKKPALAAKLGTEDLIFRVVVEDGKPKIKASLRK